MSKQSILVAGAGIGGLTAALTLQQRGLDVTVVEQAHDLKPLGVGINLLPHAVRELDELRLGDRLSRFPLHLLRFRTRTAGVAGCSGSRAESKADTGTLSCRCTAGGCRRCCSTPSPIALEQMPY
jgi:2-polyprenyl-6-methoxyphenol hydroxylase-like FAD-dependent oxidoreductase